MASSKAGAMDYGNSWVKNVSFCRKNKVLADPNSKNLHIIFTHSVIIRAEIMRFTPENGDARLRSIFIDLAQKYIPLKISGESTAVIKILSMAGVSVQIMTRKRW